MNTKKLVFTVTLLMSSLLLQAQALQTIRTEDWTKVWQSGFYDAVNIPTSPTTTTNGYQWYWGINIAHTGNSASYRYNGQIVLAQHNIFSVPTMFIRSTDSSGSGRWAKVLTEEGTQKVKGDLTVAGKVNAREIQVTVNAGADYVFEENYNLRPLSELQTFITDNKHLPDIPSERDMVENGLNMNEFQIKLLQKIEELTVYTINQQTLIEKMQEKINELEKELK